MSKNMELYLKLENILMIHNIKKIEIARKLDVTPSTIYSQFQSLKLGNSFPTNTILIIEELTKEKILNI